MAGVQAHQEPEINAVCIGGVWAIAAVTVEGDRAEEGAAAMEPDLNTVKFTSEEEVNGEAEGQGTTNQQMECTSAQWWL